MAVRAMPGRIAEYDKIRPAVAMMPFSPQETPPIPFGLAKTTNPTPPVSGPLRVAFFNPDHDSRIYSYASECTFGDFDSYDSR